MGVALSIVQVQRCLSVVLAQPRSELGIEFFCLLNLLRCEVTGRRLW